MQQSTSVWTATMTKVQGSEHRLQLCLQCYHWVLVSGGGF